MMHQSLPQLYEIKIGRICMCMHGDFICALHLFHITAQYNLLQLVDIRGLLNYCYREVMNTFQNKKPIQKIYIQSY